MNEPKITPDQMEALLKFASKKLGTTPEKLAATVQNGGMSGVSGLAPELPPDQAAKIDAVLHDKAKAEALLQTPEAQKLMEQLLGKK